MARFSGKDILITGAGRGLGAALARRLAFEGAHVLMIARTSADLEAVDDAIQADAREHGTGGGATLIPFDLQQHELIDQIAANIASRHGKLDGLVMNADVLLGLQPLTSIGDKAWNQVMNTGIEAHFRLLRACDPLLHISDAGRVLLMTMEQVQHPRAFWGGVAINKAAMEMMIRTYAKEVETSSICANMFDPGRMPTAWLRTAFPGQEIAEGSEIAAEIVEQAASAVSAQELRNGQLISI